VEIQDVVNRWARAVDRRDFAALADLYHPDASNNQAEFVGGVDALIIRMEKRHVDIPYTQHLLGTPLVEFAGPDSALSETSAFCTQRVRKGMPIAVGGVVPDFVGKTDVDVLTEGRYIDRFERRDGRWRIAARTTTFAWIQLLEVPDGAFQVPEGFITGTRDRNDPLYAERAALGIVD